jgi:hypothetical protein
MSNGSGRQIPSSLLWLLPLMLLMLCIMRLWLVQLPSSFWVDETVTAFVVTHPDDASFAVAPQVPASTYYWLPRVGKHLFGDSEIAWRIPSILSMALALFFTGLLAARLIHTRSAWFAVFACLGLRGINYHAADARPYAFGMCVALAALYFLIRWLDSNRLADALLFVLLGAFLWSIQLIYWPMYLVYGLYPAVRIWNRQTAVTWTRAAAMFALMALMMAPTAVKAVSVLHDAKAHVITVVPGLRQFQHAIRWSLVVICGGCALFLARVCGWTGPRMQGVPGSLGLILACWLTQPISLYVFSNLTGNSVFVDRYLSIMLPGAALAATAAAGFSLPDRYWREASILLGVGVLLVMGNWRHVYPRHDNSDWRAAAAEERRLATLPDTPVIVLSPFVEARAPAWQPHYPLPGFLYAHLEYYPLKGKIYLFPFGQAALDGEQYARTLVQDTLPREKRFLIYGVNKSWQKWFEARPELKGWRCYVDKFGDIDLAVFNAPH